MRLIFGITVIILFTKLSVDAGTVYKTIIKNGTGPVPEPNQTVVVHYTGTLQNGEKFDSSRDRNEPFKFKLGAGEVIRGWDAGVGSMNVGERAELEIAPEDGYGVEGYPPVIPPSATLLFDIEVLAIEGVTPMPPQPAFALNDAITSSSTASQTNVGSGPQSFGNGFESANMFDNQGFITPDQSSGGFQDFNGARTDNSQGFNPPDLPMSDPRMTSTISGGSSSSGFAIPDMQMMPASGSRSGGAVPSDSFSTSMSGRGSFPSFPSQFPVSPTNGPFGFGRNTAGAASSGQTGFSMDSRFGGGSMSSQLPGSQRSGGMTGGSFPGAGIPGMDLRGARQDFSGTSVGFGSSSFDASSMSGRSGGIRPSGSTGRSAGVVSSPDSSSMRFGGDRASSSLGADTMFPGMERGMGLDIGGSQRSAGVRDFRPFGGFSGDRSSDFGSRSTMPGLGGAGSEMTGGAGMGMGGRMSPMSGMGGGMGSDAARPEMAGGIRSGFVSGIGGGMSPMPGMGGGMGADAARPGMAGGMGSGFNSRTAGGMSPMPGMGGGMGLSGVGPDMAGGSGSGMVSGRSRGMSPMQGMGGGMGSGATGPEMAGGIGPGIGSGMGRGMSTMPGSGGGRITGRGMGFMGSAGGMGFDRTRPGMGGITPFMRGPALRPGMGRGMGPGMPGMRPGSGPMAGPMGGPGMPPFMRPRMSPFMRRDAVRRRMTGFRSRR